MKETREYILTRIKEKLNEVNVMERRVISDKKDGQELQVLIQNAKRENPEASYKELRVELTRLQELHYFSFLIEEQQKLNISILKELATMADILKIDVDVEGEDKQALDFVKGMDNTMFIVDSQGDIIIPNSDNKKLLEESIKKQATSEQKLKEVYEIIPTE